MKGIIIYMKLKVFIFLLLFSSVSAFAQTKDDDALKNLVRQLTAAQTKFDSAALDKIFTADYIEISPVGEFDPRKKVLGFYKPENKPPDGAITATVEAGEFSIRVYDKFAVVIARLDFSVGGDKSQLGKRGMRATFVCRKEKSGWKIASAQYTGIRPPKTN